jgi:hypothetical protein
MIVLQMVFSGSQKTNTSVQNVEETLDRNDSSAEDVLGKAQKNNSSAEDVLGKSKNLQFRTECTGEAQQNYSSA